MLGSFGDLGLQFYWDAITAENDGELFGKLLGEVSLSTPRGTREEQMSLL